MAKEVNITNHSKDEYNLYINGLQLGIWSRGEIRHLIEQLDKINS